MRGNGSKQFLHIPYIIYKVGANDSIEMFVKIDMVRISMNEGKLGMCALRLLDYGRGKIDADAQRRL